jgi:hypothetical protein
MVETIINLGEVRASGSKVFSGQPRGKAARDHFRVHELDKGTGVVIVQIPEDTYSIGPSFLLGMFEPSIIRLGRERFLEKYRFPWNEVLLDSIYETVARACKTSNVLCA